MSKTEVFLKIAGPSAEGAVVTPARVKVLVASVMQPKAV
jgi:hypothetical protein